MPFNILEATAVEAATGCHENACAGLTLARHHPGKYTRHASELDEQGLEPLFNYPMPKQWSDLYASWNLRFCVTNKERAELLSKLLIPPVSGYQGKPEAYIVRRAYALYTTLNYLIFRSEKPNPVPVLPKVVEQVWGHNNRVCSRLYQRKVTSQATDWKMAVAA
ncbi:hypothetical protein [Endozoicomonas sp. ONNA2]|uniref:hypothetical protein n=1 Tax=Endozoicomonas sp. ONNA2 TaxID=2828741 RepID=UPI0021486E48|nr:hypothetical protein [Endozoicomonas sp. ONNA2]